jgi:hypothetical protein
VFLVFHDNVMPKPLWGSTVALEPEKDCVDALLEEIRVPLGTRQLVVFSFLVSVLISHLI